MRALCLLLGCELIGDAARAAAHLSVPGPVIGMMLLGVLLIVHRRNPLEATGEPHLPPALERVSESLIAHMGLLFVPAGVGVITEAAVLKAEWLPILVGVVGSTLIGLVVTALVMQWTLPVLQAEPEDEPLARGLT